MVVGRLERVSKSVLWSNKLRWGKGLWSLGQLDAPLEGFRRLRSGTYPDQVKRVSLLQIGYLHYVFAVLAKRQGSTIISLIGYKTLAYIESLG